MPKCYSAAAPDVWPGLFMSACCGTVLPLSFTEEIQTLEAVSVAENVNVKGLKQKTMILLLVGCLTSQQQASVSQGRICSDNFTCCHTEIEVADQKFYPTQSQYTDTGPTSPSVDPIMPGTWQGSHWSANF